MAHQLFKLPKAVNLDASANVLPGAKAYFYATTTTTPQDTFTTSALNVANANPVVADANGVFGAIYLDPALTYKLTLKTSADALIYTIDPVNDQILSQAIIGQYLYPRTAAEISVGVTPANYAYPPLDVRRYGITGDGTDEHLKIQAALNVAAVTGGNVIFPVPPVSYNLGSTPMTPQEGVIIIGDAAEEVIFDFAGNGYAFDFTGGNNGLVNCYVRVNNVNGGGAQWGNDSRRAICDRVTIQNIATPAANRTGTGISLFTTTAATTFSGDMELNHLRIIGFKYGITFDCFEIALKTWTTVVGVQVFIAGAGAGIIAGSRCIIMTATTNGVGSAIFGGTLEGCEAPIEVANGGFGISYYGDVESNTSDAPILGASYCGEVVIHPSGKTYRAGSNGAVNRWHNERNVNGEWSRETWTNHYLDLYDSGGVATLTIGRGASRIAGGSPTTKWAFTTGNSGADNGANRNSLKNPQGQFICGDSNSPEAAVTAPIGSIYQRLNGGAVTSVYFKESGTGNTGWVAK